MFAFERGQPTDAAAHHHPEPAGIDQRHIESRVIHHHFRRSNGKLHETIRTPRVLGNPEITIRLEILHLAGDLAIEGLGIELGDPCYPAAASFQSLPGGG